MKETTPNRQIFKKRKGKISKLDKSRVTMSSQNLYTKTLTPGSQTVIIFGDKYFEKVTKLK